MVGDKFLSEVVSIDTGKAATERPRFGLMSHACLLILGAE